ncbi:hypothetical protein B0J13DRAFT_613709 [Dactylonectria estremocensis]|uniref:BHLH domain-containing protein n=1 Tax=Dactylonectria estremocensis TaxID=1079267 RepID=A0A9P9D6L1_9HYPO|nr:hypothetical protein B0J13DRAFT_613709 [Dactylonectria estremocensis]
MQDWNATEASKLNKDYPQPIPKAPLMEYDLDLEAFNCDQERCLTTVKQILAPGLCSPFPKLPLTNPASSASLSVDSFSLPTASFTSPGFFSSDEPLLYDCFSMTPSNTGSAFYLPYSVSPTALPKSGGIGGLCGNDDDCDIIDQRQAKQEYTSDSKSLNPRGKKRRSPMSQETEQPRESQPQNGNMDAGTERRTGIKLRTTSCKPEKPSSKKLGSNKAPLSRSVARSRHSHNLVEKQYRNRLNQQFNNLLAALPAPQSEDCNRHDIGDRCFSKAEVLERARQRIKSLETENEVLAKERDRLMGNISPMQETIK